MEMTIWINGAQYEFRMTGKMRIFDVLAKTGFHLDRHYSLFDFRGRPLDREAAVEDIPKGDRKEAYVFSKSPVPSDERKKQEFRILSRITEILFPFFIHAFHGSLMTEKLEILSLIAPREEELAGEIKKLSRALKVGKQPYIIRRQVLFEHIRDHFAHYETQREVWTDEAIDLLFEIIDQAYGIQGEDVKRSA